MPQFVIALSFAEEHDFMQANPQQLHGEGIMLWRGSYAAEAKDKWEAIAQARSDVGGRYRIEAHEMKAQADTAPFFHWDKPALLKKCCELEKDIHHARLRGFSSVEEMASVFDQLQEMAAVYNA